MSVNMIVVAEEQTHDLPFDPVVFGLIAFVMLLTLLFALLMFGKGRPHS